MKIAVCVKRTPDTEARIKVGADGISIDPTAVKFVMNPYDEFAVEEALQLKERAGGGEIVVVSLGGDAAKDTIRAALAMGADRGILLQTDATLADGLPVAKAIAEALEGESCDLVLFGKLAVDDGNGQVGPMVGEILGLATVTAVGQLDIDESHGTAEREIEGGVEVVEFPLPAVLTTEKGLNEPRYPALKGIMAAKKKPIEVKPVTLAPAACEIVQLTLPPQRAGGRIVGDGVDAVPELVRLLREEAKAL